MTTVKVSTHCFPPPPTLPAFPVCGLAPVDALTYNPSTCPDKPLPLPNLCLDHVIYKCLVRLLILFVYLIQLQPL